MVRFTRMHCYWCVAGAARWHECCSRGFSTIRVRAREVGSRRSRAREVLAREAAAPFARKPPIKRPVPEQGGDHGLADRPQAIHWKTFNPTTSVEISGTASSTSTPGQGQSCRVPRTRQHKVVASTRPANTATELRPPTFDSTQPHARGRISRGDPIGLASCRHDVVGGKPGGGSHDLSACAYRLGSRLGRRALVDRVGQWIAVYGVTTGGAPRRATKCRVRPQARTITCCAFTALHGPHPRRIRPRGGGVADRLPRGVIPRVPESYGALRARPNRPSCAHPREGSGGRRRLHRSRTLAALLWASRSATVRGELARRGRARWPRSLPLALEPKGEPRAQCERPRRDDRARVSCRLARRALRAGLRGSRR